MQRFLFLSFFTTLLIGGDLLDKKEFHERFGKVISKKHHRMLFNNVPKMDLNKDGKITYEEYLKGDSKKITTLARNADGVFLAHPLGLMKVALSQGANPNIEKEPGLPLLHRMISTNKVDDYVLILLEAPGLNINLKDKNGKSALTYACYHNNTYIIPYLIKKGIDVEAKDNYNQTAIMHAKNKEVLKAFEPFYEVAMVESQPTLFEKKKSFKKVKEGFVKGEKVEADLKAANEFLDLFLLTAFQLQDPKSIKDYQTWEHPLTLQKLKIPLYGKSLKMKRYIDPKEIEKGLKESYIEGISPNSNDTYKFESVYVNYDNGNLIIIPLKLIKAKRS
jgi:hypothetical protein